MMIKAISVLLMILAVGWQQASAQQAPTDTSRAVIDSVYALVKAEWLYSDAADWPRIDAAFEAEVAAAGSFGEALGAFRRVFGAQGDVHSAIYYAGRGIAYRPANRTPSTRDVSALIDLSRERVGQPEGRRLGGGIGYVHVPAYAAQGANAISQAAATLRDVVCDLAPASPRGWVIDLRVNEGGNIHPMLSGLGDLLGDGVVLRSVDASGAAQFTWAIREGILSIDGYQAATVARRCPEARSGRRIAVLIGPATLSSGQITAVAFAGWEQARLFGDPTAEGYATSNRWHQITPALALNLSTAYFADRSGFIHEGTVLPDEAVPGAWHLDDHAADPVVQRALAWIRDE